MIFSAEFKDAISENFACALIQVLHTFEHNTSAPVSTDQYLNNTNLYSTADMLKGMDALQREVGRLEK